MKTRIIHTKFWLDNYIQSLKPTERLLFIFLISNEHVNMIGVYEINLSYISLCTGLNLSDIENYLHLFQEKKKIIYISGYIILLNHLKYQDYSKGSEKQKNAFKREIELLPIEVRKVAENRHNLTSLELVVNQLGTIHKSKSIKQKTKIKNQKSEIMEENLKKIVNFYNEVFNKNITSTEGFENNYKHWSDIHDLETIKQAILNASKDNFWKDKMTLTILFRRKNTRNENVDYIQDLANREQIYSGNVAIL